MALAGLLGAASSLFGGGGGSSAPVAGETSSASSTITNTQTTGAMTSGLSPAVVLVVGIILYMAFVRR